MQGQVRAKRQARARPRTRLIVFLKFQEAAKGQGQTGALTFETEAHMSGTPATIKDSALKGNGKKVTKSVIAWFPYLSNQESLHRGDRLWVKCDQ